MTSIRTYFNSLHIHYQLLIVLIGLNYVDFATTKVLVDKIGFFAEGNPLLLWAMTLVGSVYAILLIKAAMLGLTWFIVGLSRDHHEWMSPARLTAVLYILVGAFFTLISWNFFRMFQESGLI